MRACWLAVIAGCGFSARASGDANNDAPPMFDDAMREIVEWNLDAASDFTRPGSELVDMGVEPWGSLTPAGYIYGFAPARTTTTVAWTTATPDNALVWEPNNVVGIGGWDGIGFTAVTNLSHYGITAAPFTMWVEGEIFISAGQNDFSLNATDIAFLDIAPPGTAVFDHVLISRGVATTVSRTFTTTGWHPFRIGWATSTVAYVLDVEHQAPGGALRDIRRGIMRGRGEGLRGLMRVGHDHRLLADTHSCGQLLSQDDAIPNQTFPVPPPGAGSNNTQWSARYVGQFYAPLAGMYVFTASTDDGNRLSVGDATAEDGWTLAGKVVTTTATANLPAGWNDLVLDYNQVTGPLQLQLELTSSPDGTPAAPVPNQRLRPVERRGDRLITGGDGQNRIILDNNATGVTSTANLRAATTETIVSIDVQFEITSARPDDLDIELRNPANTVRVLANNDLPAATGSKTYHFNVTAANLTAGPIEGPWTLRVVDTNGGGGSSTLVAFFVTIRSRGGPDQIAPRGMWTSEIVDNPTGIAVFDDVHWVSRDLTGIPAAVLLRTCASPCTNEAWTGVANGAPPLLAPERYLQARVELSSDTTTAPELEQLVIKYRRNPVSP